MADYPKLMVLSEKFRGVSFELNRDSMSAGRNDQRDICIKDGSIQCDRAAACQTIPMWKELDEITNAYLKTITLEDLLTGQKWKSSPPPDHSLK